MRGPEQRGVGSSERVRGEFQHVNLRAYPGACAASGPLGRSPPPKDHLEHYLTSAVWRCLEDHDLRAILGKSIVAVHVRTWALSVGMLGDMRL